jgi:RNA polymerase sigma factor (sigma-70 family)
MISDDEELLLLQELAVHPAQTWDKVVTRYQHIIRDHIDQLGGDAHPIHFVDPEQCVRDVFQEARTLLRYLLPHQIEAPTLAAWFSIVAQEKWKELFVTTLVLLYSHPLTAYIATIVGKNPQDVEDCRQDTFRSAWQSIQGKSIEKIRSLYLGNPRAWLYEIAKTKAFDYLRRTGLPGGKIGTPAEGTNPAPEPPTLLPLDMEQGDRLPQRIFPEPEPEALQAENRTFIQHILTTLPIALEKPLRMHYLAGKTYVEIAQELGIPQGTARSNAHSGLRNLNNYLQVKELLKEKDVQELLPSLLSDQQLSAVRCHFFADLSIEQIAHQQGWKPDRTRGYLYRGIEIVVKHVEQKRR